jgi:hypothetical protein
VKKVKSVFRYIFAVAFAISLIIYFLINILSSTLLNKNYVLKKLDETGYYDKVYGYATSNFENYIIQSGLDKSVLDGIITREDVVNDTQKVLNNIYTNIEETVNAENLKTKLRANIDSATQGMLVTEEQKNSLNGFVEEIAKEYLNTIAHFDYEKEIFNLCHRVSFVLDATNKLVLIFAAVSLFGIMVTCGKRFYKFFSFVGFSLFTIGLFFIIMNIFVNVKVNIQTITILNDAFSFVIREILSAILGGIFGKGMLMFFGGLALIFVSNLAHNYFKYKGIKEDKSKYDCKIIKKIKKFKIKRKKDKQPKLLAEKNKEKKTEEKK